MNKLLEQPRPSVPWTPRDVAWGLLVFVLWIILLALTGLAGEQLDLPLDAGLLIVFGEAVLLLPVWYLAVRKYGATWADLGLHRFHASAIGFGCSLMLISLVFNLVYAALIGLFGLQTQPDIGPLFQTTAFPAALFFGGAIVAPVVEEIFFRGFVFAGLRSRWGWKKATLFSAGLFAVAHVVPTSILPIFILGVVFALLYQLSGSIWPAILMHMLTNTVALTVVLYYHYWPG